MTDRRRQVRVVFVGPTDDPLRALLEDALEVEWVTAEANPEVVLAVVGPHDPFRVLASAQRVAAGKSPIIAILPIADERLSRRALLAGAHACWPLDGSLKTLREAVLDAVDGR